MPISELNRADFQADNPIKGGEMKDDIAEHGNMEDRHIENEWKTHKLTRLHTDFFTAFIFSDSKRAAGKPLLLVNC